MFVWIKESTKTATHVLECAQCNAANTKLKHQVEWTIEAAKCHLLVKVGEERKEGVRRKEGVSKDIIYLCDI